MATAHQSSECEDFTPNDWSLSSSQVNREFLEDLGVVETLASGSSDDLIEEQDVFQPLTSHYDYKPFFIPSKKKRTSELPEMDPWTKLADEVILMIFRWLPKASLGRCMCVCRRWARLVMDPLLWQKIDLGSKILEEGHLGIVVSRQPVALRLAKAECNAPALAFDEALTAELPSLIDNLQFLDLSMTNIEVEDLNRLLALCRKLRKVSLEGGEINEETLKLLSFNPKLDTLNLTACRGIYSLLALKRLLTYCTMLKSLNLSWCNMSKEVIQMACKNMPPSLSRLNLSGCRSTLTDDDVYSLVKRCPSLLELDLSDAMAVKNFTLTHILRHLRNVEYLAFSRCYNIDRRAFQTLSDLPKLKYLVLFGVLTDEQLCNLRDVMPSRVSLNQFLFSSVARPTVGIHRTSIWGLKMRET